MNTPFKIMVVVPNGTDATSFYRGHMPISQLCKKNSDIQLAFVAEVNWSTLCLVDAVFVQRPSQDAHLKVAKMCNQWNVPLWIDYDDDLFSVLDDNPTHAYYGDKSTQKRIAEIIIRADVITVSTQTLKDKLMSGPGKNKDIRVVPNAWATSKLPPRRVGPRNKLILWRGSKTHQRDVASVAQEIIQLAHENPTWTWHFIGADMSQFWWLGDQLPPKNFIFSPALDIIDYLELIQTLAPALTFSPLLDSPFNRSKSNIAWMEGMYSGSIHVAPNLPEFQGKPGCAIYDPMAPNESADSFYQQMKSLMKASDEYIEVMNESGWEHIQNYLDLEVVNEARIKVVETLRNKANDKSDSRGSGHALRISQGSLHKDLGRTSESLPKPVSQNSESPVRSLGEAEVPEAGSPPVPKILSGVRDGEEVRTQGIGGGGDRPSDAGLA